MNKDMNEENAELFTNIHLRNLKEIKYRHHRAIEYAMQKMAMGWDTNRQRLSFYDWFDKYITEEESKPAPSEKIKEKEMNREIKFRWWHKENKIMDWEYLKSSPYYQNPFLRTDLITMQFTGLKDKNSKEIYEGDIIKTQDDYNSERIIEVRFGNAEFYPLANAGRIQNKIFEVIGNIYENPELLKE